MDTFRAPLAAERSSIGGATTVQIGIAMYLAWSVGVLSVVLLAHASGVHNQTLFEAAVRLEESV